VLSGTANRDAGKSDSACRKALSAARQKSLCNPLFCIKFQMIGRGGALHLCAVFQVLSGLKEGK
jgi:hypothetical protein